jgi:hypothetical protein
VNTKPWPATVTAADERDLFIPELFTADAAAGKKDILRPADPIALKPGLLASPLLDRTAEKTSPALESALLESGASAIPIQRAASPAEPSRMPEYPFFAVLGVLVGGPIKVLLPLEVPETGGAIEIPLLASGSGANIDVSMVSLGPSGSALLAVIDRFIDFLTTAGKCVTALRAREELPNPIDTSIDALEILVI